MARLVIKSADSGDRVVLLTLGVNFFGRSPENQVVIDHSTVSGRHCEIHLRDVGLLVRDLGSTNGTFVNGKKIQEATLTGGETLKLGDVEIHIDDAQVTVAIPRVDVKMPAPPVVRSDGALMCRRHEQTPAVYRCTHCRELLCEDCVHRLKRAQGAVHLLCPLCSFPCELIGGKSKKKKSLINYLFQTVKIPFSRDKHDDERSGPTRVS